MNRDAHFERLNSYRRSKEYAEYARAYVGTDAGDPATLPSLLGVRWRIDERIYMEFLEILPPMRWRGNSFLICEFCFGSITTKYTKEGDTYWCEFVDALDRDRNLDAGIRWPASRFGSRSSTLKKRERLAQ